MSYYSERMQSLHVTEESNRYDATDIDGRPIDFRFFQETDNGDIAINYIGPDGVIEVYETDNRKTRAFSRIRLREPK